MFDINETVLIRSTTELPTKYDGSKATVFKLDFMGHEGYHEVLIWNCGETAIFHESQLVPLASSPTRFDNETLRQIYQEAYDKCAGPPQFRHSCNHETYHVTALQAVVRAISGRCEDAAQMRLSIFAHHVSEILTSPAPAKFSLCPFKGVAVEIEKNERIFEDGTPASPIWDYVIMTHGGKRFNCGNRHGGVTVFTEIVKAARPIVEFDQPLPERPPTNEA